MAGLRALLFVSLVLEVVPALLLLFLPSQLARAQMAPASIPTARYIAAGMLAFATANWHAFRNPLENGAVVEALMALWGLSAVVAFWNGVAGMQAWNTLLLIIVTGAVLAAGLGYYYYHFYWLEEA